MSHLTLRDAFEVYKGLGVPKFRGVQQRTSGMNRNAWRRSMKDSKIFKDDELAKCLIAFDAATQGSNLMTFEDFEIALHHAGKQKKMSGTDVGLILVHKAMKIVEEESSTGKVNRAPTLESLKEEMRKALAKGKEKINMGPPTMRKKLPKKRPPPEARKAPASGSGSGPSSAKSNREAESDAKSDFDSKKVGEKKDEPEKVKEEEEEEEEVDFKAIAARNQYLEEQAKILADLNSMLKEGKGLSGKELNKIAKQDQLGQWDYKSPSGTISIEHPAYWDWG